MKRTLLLLPILLLSLLCAAHAQLMMMGVGPGGASGGGPVPGNIFVANPALNADDTNNNTSFRVATVLSASSTGIVKVTIVPGATNQLDIAHASICKAATPPNCTTTPVELKFSGASGFTGATTPQTSDATNHSGSFTLNSGDTAIVIYDITTFNPAEAYEQFNASATNATTYFSSSQQTWNSQNVTGFSALSGYNYGVSLIVAQ